MTKRERTPDIDAEEIIEMFRPEMRRLKPADVGLENVPTIQRVTSEPNVQTATMPPKDTTVTAEQPVQGISNRVRNETEKSDVGGIPTEISPSPEN